MWLLPSQIRYLWTLAWNEKSRWLALDIGKHKQRLNSRWLLIRVIKSWTIFLQQFYKVTFSKETLKPSIQTFDAKCWSVVQNVDVLCKLLICWKFTTIIELSVWFQVDVWYLRCFRCSTSKFLCWLSLKWRNLRMSQSLDMGMSVQCLQCSRTWF